jgi:hypothetical protein
MTRVPPHRALTGKCRLCGVSHGQGAHRSHGRGSFARSHFPVATAQGVYDALVGQVAEERAAAIVESFDPMLTHQSMRKRRDPMTGGVEGRLSGSFKGAFPELRRFDHAPGRIRASLMSKRSSGLNRSLREAIRDQTELDEGEAIRSFMEAHPIEAIESAGLRVPGRRRRR